MKKWFGNKFFTIGKNYITIGNMCMGLLRIESKDSYIEIMNTKQNHKALQRVLESAGFEVTRGDKNE